MLAIQFRQDALSNRLVSHVCDTVGFVVTERTSVVFTASVHSAVVFNFSFIYFRAPTLLVTKNSRTFQDARSILAGSCHGLLYGSSTHGSTPYTALPVLLNLLFRRKLSTTTEHPCPSAL